ncbi:CC0125/CC1285 family lipoprotein [Solimonas terrae]|uniref:Uncharacterized protein n=1 Tax=Solimonas terrae TaxID=1396819 RepID=A0A6M2BRF8_9GAMM|nr:hypothetical protein [Solimonas terrae]NGY05176.1 hypothetical protein [Solimonas terrae]
MKRRDFLAVLATVMLAACATTTPYQPIHDGYGYQDQRIEANRFRVTFTGSSATPRQTVENYLLYHAAELTLNSGNDYFVITQSSTSANGKGGPGLSLGFGGVSFGSHSGLGLGVGTSTGGDQVEYSAQAEIVTYKGKKPDDNPQAFDAREVKQNLDAKIMRPASP